MKWAGASHSRVWSGDTAGHSPLQEDYGHPSEGGATSSEHSGQACAGAPATTVQAQAMESLRQLAELRTSRACPDPPAAGAHELAARHVEGARLGGATAR